MLEPVAKASSRRDEAELGAGPEHDLLREPRAVHHRDCRAGLKLEHEIAIGDGVDTVGRCHLEAELSRRVVSVDRIRHAGQGAAAERPDVEAGVAGPEALLVALKHLEVGQEVMREQNRLGALQVRVARHDRRLMFLRASSSSASRKPMRSSMTSSHASRTSIRKSVATWSLRERAVCSLPATGADPAGQLGLDVHVDVFERLIELNTGLPRGPLQSPPGRARSTPTRVAR